MFLSSNSFKFTFLLIAFIECTTEQLQQGAEILSEGMSSKGTLTSDQIGRGLKQALTKGAETASSQLSRKDGFFRNQAIKILFPSEFSEAEKTLRKVGMGFLADQAITSFNKAAEDASKKAFPILASAVKNMTIQDAMGILMGQNDSATEYLKKTTTQPLYQAFFPVVKKSSDSVLATQHWAGLAKKYNSIPFVKPLPTDINKYITEKTLNGLFHMVKKEEALIRKNPVHRTTDLLKSVFGYADSKRKAS